MADSPDAELDRLIYPTARSDFYEQFWDRAPLIIQRDSPEHYAGLLAYDELLAAATRFNPPPPIAHVKEGLKLAPETITHESLLQALDEGVTLVFKRLTTWHQPTARLCRQLESAFTHPVGANAYLTPPGSQGLLPHYDRHDVFVLQIDGTKHWRIYDHPARFPMELGEYDESLIDTRDVLHDLVLKAGDFLYLPAGTSHEVKTSDSRSLHITISINKFSWYHVLAAAIWEMAEHDWRFRQPLPAGFARTADFPADLAEHARQLLDEIHEKGDLAQGIKDVARQFMLAQRRVSAAPLNYPVESATVTMDSVLMTNPQVVMRLETHSDGLRLIYSGGQMRLPATMQPAVEALMAADRFSCEAIRSDLSAADVLRLVETLVEEGIVLVKDGSGR